jgi:aspartate/tyrosine/aromatic aminotransferase
MFETLAVAPPDPILGLIEAFQNDPRAIKINLGVGVYQDEQGCTPILASVKEAERRILVGETTKSYLGIGGHPTYGQLVQQLILGADEEAVRDGRAATLQTPGGTGALRVAADFLHQMVPGTRVWCSQPTWANHQAIFQAAGLETATYAYFEAERNALDFEAMLADLNHAQTGDVVLLHACCHNPTGIDPSPTQWQRIAKLVAAHRLLPLVDFAYQGFGDGLQEDAAGLRTLVRSGCELLVASSFSKNFGLYRERVGALTVVAGTPGQAEAARSQLQRAIRANYSNPPAHGAAIVQTVLEDAELRPQWEAEVAAMRGRIQDMRGLLVDTMRGQGVPRDFSFLREQRGMFSFSGLSPEQADELRQRHAIYMVRSGRINVAGITPANVGRLCAAIAQVL